MSDVPVLRRLSCLNVLAAVVAFASAAMLPLVGCAGTHFDGARFRKKGVSYRIGRLDPAWQRVDVEGNDLAFAREGLGTISVNATCKGYDDLPPEVLLNHLLFGTTDRNYVLDEEVTIDGRGARHALIRCELDGVPVSAELYMLTRDGCVFDLAYISGIDAPAHELFAQFARGFHVEARHD